jgi:hypothetical protein
VVVVSSQASPVLGATIWISEAVGSQPTPTQRTVGAAVTSLVAIAGAWRLKIAERWGIATITRRMIQDAFREKIGAIPLHVPANNPRVLAYHAVETDEISVHGDTVQG